MKQIIYLILFILLPTICFADAYSWVESNGKIVYGTNPPKSATNVKNLTTRGLSRYSSNKVLNRMGWRGSLASSESAPEIKSQDINIQGLEVGRISEGDLPAIENLPIPTEEKPAETKAEPAKLETSKIKIILDEVNSKIVNRCKVEVSNIGGKTAENVAIAFEFRDGTLIPAAGPAIIEAGKSAVYKIPADLVPLKLNFGLSRKKPEKAMKVVVDWQK